MMDILLMEPSSINKRRRISDKLRGQEQAPSLSLDEIIAKLKGIRQDTAEFMDEHCKTLMMNLSRHNNVKVVYADTAGKAAAEIKQINDGRQIAVNKSSVVNNEIVPELLKSNLSIIETYYDEFKPSDNQLNEYLKLPDLDIDTVFNTFQITSHPDVSRKENISKTGSKDFTGLLGLNAISANDGSISLFQHMGNIGSIFEQARKIIFVVGLDKIVRDREEAVFQTRCMAAFGWKAILKAQQFDRQPKTQLSIRDMPYDVSPPETDPEIHLIILDNGRKRLRNGRYKDLLNCIGCRACMKDCPVSSFFNVSNYYLSGKWNPKEYISYYVQEKNSSLDICLQCKTCEMNCPLDIDIPDMILEARADAMKSGKVPLIYSLLSNFGDIAKLSTKTPTFANALSKNTFLRHCGEKFAGVSSKRNMPEFQNPTFEKWFGNRTK
jgi:L-lactate utilization protein LutB